MKTGNKLERAKRVRLLKKSSAYRMAYKDLDFLGSDYARAARLQLELLKTEIGMRHNNVKSTIVTFGGTRIMEPSKAGQKVKRLETAIKRNPRNPNLKKRLRIAKSILKKSKYYDEAREFGRLVSSECQIKDHSEYVIITGGGPGIMEAANRGAYEAGAKSIGLNITLPMEQEPNPYITPELCFQFHYFAIRKMHFMLRAKALVAFPGGFGTLDELFEALTLVQTEKIKPLPIVLFGEEFWRRAVDFDYLMDEGTIDPEDINLFAFADSAIDAWNYIKDFNRG
ncbi:MAG: TIGR00730 family Rossman fold protein [Candidatus Zixiibacteriota bacterium]|nr:MAG: TIGR00730 family Rossman fold protein [candidate division Zixibacteria bacterium]